MRLGTSYRLTHKQKAMEKLLIVDDNEDIRKQLRWGLAREYALELAGDAAAALDAFHAHRPGVVLLDLGLPPHEDSSDEGFRCLAQMLEHDPAAKVIVITGNDTQENAMQAVHMGAYDFYRKPIDLDELRIIIRRAFHLHGLELENSRLQSRQWTNIPGHYGMLGQCPKMQDVFRTIRKVAPSDVSVLVCGESGTGKELAARAIHAQSPRSQKEFVALNCGAIPENLLESELFGHEKGAYTGAHSTVMGKCEYAHQGTLFLDEIGELPLNLQVKLLRFLQEKTVQRVGGRRDIPADARIIAATNVDIPRAMEQGRFREDLYYRIGVVTIIVPPLRERDDDILLLANLFLRRVCEEFNYKGKEFSPRALECLRAHAWPGNVREMENKVQRAVIMSSDRLIRPGDLGFAEDHRGPSHPVSPTAAMSAADRPVDVQKAPLDASEVHEVHAAGASHDKAPVPPANAGPDALLRHIQDRPGQRVREISEALGLPQRTAERRIRDLKDQGLIEFRGAPKTGGYFSRR